MPPSDFKQEQSTLFAKNLEDMKLLITTSTLPVSDCDPVPDFVKKQAIYLKKFDSSYRIYIHAPHNFNNRTYCMHEEVSNTSYMEIRYHYFYPYKLELLAGRGILPALKNNKWLYLQIPLLFIFHGLTLFSLAKKTKPDLIYAHWFTPQAINAAIVAKILNIPFIFTTHSSDVSILKRLPFSRNLVKWVCHHSAGYTAVSEKTARKLADFFSEEEWSINYSHKLKIMPMGIPDLLTTRNNNDADHSETTRRQGITSKFRILFIGRLVQKKGVDSLIQAIAKIPHNQKKFIQLIIAGEGSEETPLRNLIRELDLSDSVIFTGYVFDATKDNLYKQANVVCIPSLVAPDGDSEGFPLVLMESLFHGKIVIASNASGAEAILDNKTNGFIFEANSSENLKDTILKVVALDPEKKKSISEKAREIGQTYTWDKLIPEYNQLFKSVL